MLYAHTKTGGTSLRRYILSGLSQEKISSNIPNFSASEYKISLDQGYTVYVGHFDQNFWNNRQIKPYYITVLRKPVDLIVSRYYFWRSHNYQYIDEKWGGYFAVKFCKRNSFNAFLNSQHRGIRQLLFNAQARQLALSLNEEFNGSSEELLTLAIRRLSAYTIIGVTEFLDPMMELTASQFPFSCVSKPERLNSNESLKDRFPDSYSPRPKKITESLERKIIELNLVDLTLYEWAKSKWLDGCYQPPQGFALELEKAMSILKQIQQQYQIAPNQKARVFATLADYSNFKQWQNFSTTACGELQLSALTWPINTGAQCVSGKQIVSVSLLDNGATQIATTNIANERHQKDVLFGMIDTGVMPSEQLTKHSQGSILVNDKLYYLEWTREQSPAVDCLHVEFDTQQPSHLESLATLQKQFSQQLSAFYHIDRNLDYFTHRYYQHPHWLYSSRLISDKSTGLPVSIAFIKRTESTVCLMDYIGDFKFFEQTISCIFALNDKFHLLKMALPKSITERLGVKAPIIKSSNYYSFTNQKNANNQPQDFYLSLGDSADY